MGERVEPREIRATHLLLWQRPGIGAWRQLWVQARSPVISLNSDLVPSHSDAWAAEINHEPQVLECPACETNTCRHRTTFIHLTSGTHKPLPIPFAGFDSRSFGQQVESLPVNTPVRHCTDGRSSHSVCSRVAKVLCGAIHHQVPLRSGLCGHVGSSQSHSLQMRPAIPRGTRWRQSRTGTERWCGLLGFGGWPF